MKEPQKYIRTIHYDTDGGVRKFRCFNIEYYVGNEIASEIVDELLEKMGFDINDLESEERAPGEVYAELMDIVLLVKTNELKRTIPEVTIIVHGTIDDDDIEDLLCEEISEATNWLHEGFEFEEIKENQTK
jgi:hypothetical protein